jgi:hypothetical protein
MNHVKQPYLTPKILYVVLTKTMQFKLIKLK